MAAPTISGQPANSRPRPAAPSRPSRLDRASSDPSRGRGSESRRWCGSGLTSPPRGHHVASLGHGVDLGRGHLRAGPAGPWSAWPGPAGARPGAPATAAGPARRTRRRAGAPGPYPSRSVASWWAASWSARANDRCSPWDAWVRDGSPASGELELVPVRARPSRHPRCDVLGHGPRPGRRAAGPIHERTYVEPDLGGSRRPDGRSARSTRGASWPTSCSRASTRRVPASSSRASQTSRVDAASGAGATGRRCASSAARWRSTFSTSSAGSRRLRIHHGQGLVQEPAPVGGSRPDHPDVLGGEHRHPQRVVQVAASPDRLPVHLGPGPARGRTLRPRWSASGSPTRVSARRMALSAPRRTSASLGEPRNDWRVAR